MKEYKIYDYNLETLQKFVFTKPAIVPSWVAKTIIRGKGMFMYSCSAHNVQHIPFEINYEHGYVNIGPSLFPGLIGCLRYIGPQLSSLLRHSLCL